MQRAGDTFRDLSPARLFAVVALPLLVLYLATASWTLPYHIDAATNVFTAFELGTEGNVILEDHEALVAPEYSRTIAWIVPAEDSVAAQYPPGAPVLAAPIYAIWPDDARYITVYNEATDAPPIEILMPPLGPAAITAAVTAAVVVGLLAVAFAFLEIREINFVFNSLLGYAEETRRSVGGFFRGRV